MAKGWEGQGLEEGRSLPNCSAFMLSHTRNLLLQWASQSRSDKFLVARELLVLGQTSRVREDLLFENLLPALLRELGNAHDLELSLTVARAAVNLTSSDEAHMAFLHPLNMTSYDELFERPWLTDVLNDLKPEPLAAVLQLLGCRELDAEASKLACALLLNLCGSTRLQEAVAARSQLAAVLGRVASGDADEQRLAAGAVWNLSKHAEILKMLAKMQAAPDEPNEEGMPLKVLLDAVPHVISDAAQHLDLDTQLGGDPDLCLAVTLTSTGQYLLMAKAHKREPRPCVPRGSIKLAVTPNPQLGRREATARVEQRARAKAEHELERLEAGAAQLALDDLKHDLSSLGYDTAAMLERGQMERALVLTLLSDRSRKTLGLPRRPDPGVLLDHRAASSPSAFGSHSEP